MKALSHALQPVRLRVRLGRAARLSDHALCALAAYGLGVRILMFLTPIESPAVFLWPMLAASALAVAAAFVCPVSNRRAAAAADACGLRQRALTALERLEDPSPMAALQREDALKALAALDAKRAMPVRASRGWWAVTSVCALLLAALAFVPNPQNAVVLEKQALRAALATQAEAIDKASDALPATEDPDRLAELKKLAKALSQSLRESQTSREALLALNEADDAIRRIERQQAQSAAETAGKALDAGGLESLRQALASGDASQLERAALGLSAGDASTLTGALASAADAAPAGSTLQAALRNAAQAAPGTAQSAALSQLAQKLSAAATSASTRQLSALLASAKASLGASAGKGASGASGAGGSGNGGGAGAGSGTTNKDAGIGQGGAKKRNAATGSGAPIVKTGAYESIYDPTRLGDGGEISQSTGPVSEGDVFRADLAPGLGEAGGKVPFAQSARSYGQAAAKAAGQPGVPEDVRKMVSAYFNALIDESEG